MRTPGHGESVGTRLVLALDAAGNDKGHLAVALEVSVGRCFQGFLRL